MTQRYYTFRFLELVVISGFIVFFFFVVFIFYFVKHCFVCKLQNRLEIFARSAEPHLLVGPVSKPLARAFLTKAKSRAVLQFNMYVVIDIKLTSLREFNKFTI